MKNIKNKTILAVLATVLLAGTAMFISCDKENQASLNSSHSDTKSENVSTNSLFEDHDYSISINGNGVNKTIYGKIGSDVKGARVYIGGVLYEYSYIYSDEELYTLSKIGENTISLEIDSLTSEYNKVSLSNVSQEGNTVSFDINHNNVYVATCTMECPYNTGDFMNLLPYTNLEAKLSDYGWIGDVCRAVADVVVAIFTTSDNDVQIANGCVAGFHEQAKLCLEGGGTSYEIRHTRKHRRCKFTCNLQ